MNIFIFLVDATKNIRVEVCADESCKLCGITEEFDKNMWFTVHCEDAPLPGNQIQLTNPTKGFLQFCEMKIYGYGLLFSIFYSSPQFTSKVCPKTENTFFEAISRFHVIRRSKQKKRNQKLKDN